MNYVPTLLDAASDLRRCVYSSLSKKGFKNPSVETFLSHAEAILSKLEDQIDPSRLDSVKERLKKAGLKASPPNKRREDLLMAATLVQNSAGQKEKAVSHFAQSARPEIARSTLVRSAPPYPSVDSQSQKSCSGYSQKSERNRCEDKNP